MSGRLLSLLYDVTRNYCQRAIFHITLLPTGKVWKNWGACNHDRQPINKTIFCQAFQTMHPYLIMYYFYVLVYAGTFLSFLRRFWYYVFALWPILVHFTTFGYIVHKITLRICALSYILIHFCSIWYIFGTSWYSFVIVATFWYILVYFWVRYFSQPIFCFVSFLQNKTFWHILAQFGQILRVEHIFPRPTFERKMSRIPTKIKSALVVHNVSICQCIVCWEKLRGGGRECNKLWLNKLKSFWAWEIQKSK